MIQEKPYALSCDKNSQPILEALKKYLPSQGVLLEVGAGTAQHAIFMAPHFPKLSWVVSDQQDRHPGIEVWLNDFPRSNVSGPLEYVVGGSSWPTQPTDVVFTANTLHIMSWELNIKLFDDLSKNLQSKALFIVYGAFNYNGTFTSDSNKTFNEWLKERDPKSAIRDFEKVCSEMKSRDFNLVADEEMPANNRMLIFQKI